MKILLLEDNRNDAELTRASLMEEWPECTIETVNNRRAFETKLQDTHDLIISDFSLDDFNGLDALRMAKAKDSSKPFIFLSGTIGEERALEALRAGATDYIIKDRPKRLVPAVRRAMQEADASRLRVKTEEQLVQVQRLENLGILAAGIAHDFNNLLTPILLGTSVLKNKITSPGELAMLNTIEQSAARGASLVKQIMGFTRATSGEPQLVQPKHILRELMDVLEQTFSKKIKLRQEVPNDLWPVKINPTQLYQVLLNLCVNAQDAMPNGGKLTIIAKNHPASPAQSTPLLTIEVSDTGSGIPTEILERIWEPFFTTKQENKGTGLGLAIARSLVEESGGRIDLTTQAGRGTAFVVWLPAMPSALSKEPAKLEGDTSAKGELILLVDDDARIRDMLETVLKNRGYQVLSASDGAEALALFTPRHLSVRAIITDSDMPFLDGDGLITVVRRLSPLLPILMISGRPSPAMSHGERHFSFLPKPFRTDQVLGELRKLLNQSEQHAAK